MLDFPFYRYFLTFLNIFGDIFTLVFYSWACVRRGKHKVICVVKLSHRTTIHIKLEIFQIQHQQKAFATLSGFQPLRGWVRGGQWGWVNLLKNENIFFQYINVGLIIKKVIKNDISCKITRNKGTGRLAVSYIPL